MKSGYSKKIVVKKRQEIIAYRIMAGLLFVCWVGAMIIPNARDFSLIFPLSYLMIGLPFHLYYELWRITFTSKEIRIRRWSFREKVYSYSMIREVTKGYAGIGYDYLICCVFTNGKRVTFSSKDVNAGPALKRLSRFPIRTVNYINY